MYEKIRICKVLMIGGVDNAPMFVDVHEISTGADE